MVHTLRDEKGKNRRRGSYNFRGFERCGGPGKVFLLEMNGTVVAAANNGVSGGGILRPSKRRLSCLSI